MKEFLSKYEKIGKTFFQKVFARNDESYEKIFRKMKIRKISTEEPHKKIWDNFPQNKFQKIFMENEIVLKVYKSINGQNENMGRPHSPSLTPHSPSVQA